MLAWLSPEKNDPAKVFYDELSESYHLLSQDWRGFAEQQARILHGIIEVQAPQLAARRELLDCACGIGTQAIGLARLGYAVSGTDVSPKSIERARREGRDAGLEVPFAVADYRNLKPVVQKRYPIVIACGNALPHMLTEDDLERALASIFSVLEPGGLFVTSFRDYDTLAVSKPHSTPTHVWEGPHGRRVIFQTWDWVSDDRYQSRQFLLQEEAGRWSVEVTSPCPFRAMSSAVLERALKRAGFLDTAFTLPKDSGYYQVLATAHKPR